MLSYRDAAFLEQIKRGIDLQRREVWAGFIGGKVMQIERTWSQS